jgi:6-phosphogluconolactonase
VAQGTSKPTLVYVGTYTEGASTSKGIHLFRLQTENLDVPQNVTLVPLGLAAESRNPSFLELDAKRRLLFAVNEIDRFEGQPTGAVSAFAIGGNGTLTLVNQRPSMGTGPCHLTLDRTGRHLLVANYGGGSVSVLPVAADGRLGAATAAVQHKGQSVNPERQRGPHAHCVTMDAANRFAFVCDLGLDQVVIYRFDAQRGTLTPNDPPFAAIKPGSGPRHMAFLPDNRFAYVANEMTSTITAFRFDRQRGALTEFQTVSTLPEHFERTSSIAEIATHPSGKWLYVSNRGHDSVVLFSVDPSSGRLTHVEDQSTGGAKPRHFGIEPSAKHLAIGNQDSNTVLVCRIDDGNGRLKPSGVFASVPSPVCVQFLPPV